MGNSQLFTIVEEEENESKDLIPKKRKKNKKKKVNSNEIEIVNVTEGIEKMKRLIGNGVYFMKEDRKEFLEQAIAAKKLVQFRMMVTHVRDSFNKGTDV